jgi:hypothetical protein
MMWWVSSFERAVRECTRVKYVVAIFGPVHECDDNFFCWFEEILKRSLVNEVGPVRYNNSEWVLQQTQITLNMIVDAKTILLFHWIAKITLSSEII